jgi:hypothetical protein
MIGWTSTCPKTSAKTGALPTACSLRKREGAVGTHDQGCSICALDFPEYRARLCARVVIGASELNMRIRIPLRRQGLGSDQARRGVPGICLDADPGVWVLHEQVFPQWPLLPLLPAACCMSCAQRSCSSTRVHTCAEATGGRKGLIMSNIWLTFGCLFVFGPHKTSCFLTGSLSGLLQAQIYLICLLSPLLGLRGRICCLSPLLGFVFLSPL